MTTPARHLPHLAAVTFRGADAATFLNGQLTINAPALAAGSWRRAAYCSRQGRMLANGILVNAPAAEADAEPHYTLLLSADIADPTAAMLKKFVLRAKVKIDTPPAHIFCTGDATPAQPGGSVSVQNDIVEVDEGGGRKLHYNTDTGTQTLADMQTLLGGADESAEADGGTAWQREEIQRGVAWIGAATQDALIPQFVNFELLGGVDFQKGCFVGQEVIARLHHLGDVKRRGMIVRGGGAAQPGDALHTPAGKPAGEIANAAPADGGGFIAFAALAKAAAADGVQLAGNALEVQPPPYPIVEQEKFKRK